MVGGAFGPEMLQLLIDGEQTAIHLAKKFGVPDHLIRDVGERQQMVQMAQQMQQQTGIDPNANPNIQALGG